MRRPVRRVIIRCPVSADTFAALTRGDATALESDPWAAGTLAVIRTHPVLGDFGLYRGVFEAAPGIEGFTPTAGATPVAGAPGRNTLSHAVTITTYLAAGADQSLAQAALDALLAAHPWETPVIELDSEPCQLLSRA